MPWLELFPEHLRAARWLLPTLACCLALGCGSKLHHVSGTVTFKGKPVPQGKIYFSPDGSKGNKGAAGFADIKDGAYDTKAKGGQGTIGGPVIVTIQGSDGSKALFVEYKTPVDLPKEGTTKDFDVPESAAKGLPKDPGPLP